MARKNFIPRAAGIAFAVSLSLATPAQVRAQAEAKAHQAPLELALPDDTTPAEDFAIALDRYLRMTVPVTIAGAGPFRFLIDTGAQATVITKRVTDRLQLVPTGQAMLVAMGSSRMVETIELDGLEFANRRLDGLTAPLLDARHVGADGILGLDSLQNLRVLMDFRENRISVSDAHDASCSGYEIVVRARRKLGQMIITDARIDGVRTAVIIDTGAANSHGNAALRRRLGARQEDELLTTDVHGFELRSDLAVADVLRIGGLRMERVPIGYAESPVFAQLGLDDRPALILGMQSLRAFDRVAIDFAERRILFDLPDGSRASGFARGNLSP
ncbi:hypothetical protein A9995_14685 [Erythrobacter sp. QSSC1-22B]|uniref:retroviral-like aspartic protease family protein n=1 Tax=Erythrobacter sp. QSSC1-22B TaxID=1860125 RepID=UPI000804E715|nr:retroviral-like aspartic protease family protein [Erythrobacter sp. QSSC1-22B]OBX17760.1 hypothetical protein A9995_14685 [Erythrobacter sp. QSSC1-22B]